MKRRFITTEQIEFQMNLTLRRLKKTLRGAGIGISKLVNWRGGGTFVYCELKEWNETLDARVREADDEAALERVIADIRANGYWRYSVDQSLWDWGEFAKLAFDERKAILIDSLDANHLYVNYGDIADPVFSVSKEDIAVNRAFYEGDGA
jgi:adenine-specific DNA-methyltransferase